MKRQTVLLTHGPESRNLMDREPALIVGILASAIVALAAHFNIVIDKASLGAVLMPLVSAAVIRSRVKAK